MRYRCHGGAAALCLIVALHTQRALAQQPAEAAAPPAAPAPAREPDFAERTMKGHTFVYPSTFDAAFVTTHFGIGVGLAYLYIPDIPVEDQSYDVQLAGIREGFDLGVRFHERVGIFGEIGASAFSGVNVESAILQGASASLDWQAGVAGMILRSERTGTQLAARAKLVGSTGRAVQPLQLLVAFAAAPESSTNDVIRGDIGDIVLTEQDAIGGGGSILAAQAIGRHVSAQAGVQLTHQAISLEQFDAAEGGQVELTGSQTTLGVGVAVAATAYPFVPIGVMAEYRLDATLGLSVEGEEVETIPGHFVGGGIYYTGRRSLDLGALVGTVLLTQSDLDLTTVFGEFTMRYFF